MHMRKRNRVRLKRWAVLVARWAMVPLAVVGLRLLWGVEAHWRLERVRAEMRAQGVPVVPEDWPDPRRIPPEADAVAPFLRAVDGFKLTLEQRMVVEPSDPKFRRDSSDLSAQQVMTVRQIGEQKKAALAEMDVAAGRRQYAWSPVFEEYFSSAAVRRLSLSDQRLMVYWYGDMAILMVAEHQDAEALHNVRRMLAVARIQDQQPTLIAHMMAAAERGLAADCFERVLFTMDWQGADVAREARLLQEELREAGACSDLEMNWKGEVVFDGWYLRRGRLFEEGQTEKVSWWLSPLRDEDESQMLRRAARQRPVAAARNYPEAKTRMPAVVPPHDSSRLTAAIHAWSDEVYEDWGRAALVSDRVVAALRGSTMLLAARLYFLDHGRWPKEGELDAAATGVMVDPFDGKGGKIRYRVDATGPTVWSVGENGTDEGGQLDPARGYERNRNHPDIVFGAGWREFLKTMPKP